MKQCKLPNGEKIYCVDKLTAVYVYNEIYEDKVYQYGGLEIKDGDIILDIGGNIGMFSKFASSIASNLKVFTFEPVPQIFEVLEKNLANLSATFKNFNIGLGDKNETIEFNYYPKCSGDSAAVEPDREKMIDIMVENYKETVVSDVPIAKLVPKFLRRKVITAGMKSIYKPVKVTCKIRPLSEIIRENNIERIDFMKIDAENYEWPVLMGIDDEHWSIIKQIAMEVHTHIDGGENLMQEIRQLLEPKGFEVCEGEESRETILGVYMLYAKKK